jgi:hypothetical protein
LRGLPPPRFPRPPRLDGILAVPAVGGRNRKNRRVESEEERERAWVGGSVCKAAPNFLIKN